MEDLIGTGNIADVVMEALLNSNPGVKPYDEYGLEMVNWNATVVNADATPTVITTATAAAITLHAAAHTLSGYRGDPCPEIPALIDGVDTLITRGWEDSDIVTFHNALLNALRRANENSALTLMLNRVYDAYIDWFHLAQQKADTP